MRPALLLLPAALLALAATPARAQEPPRARLVLRVEYIRGPGARCPDEHVVADMLQGELSYDARPEAELHLVVEATRQGRGEHRVSVVLRDATGDAIWSVVHQSADCVAAIEAGMASTALQFTVAQELRERRARAEAEAAAVVAPAAVAPGAPVLAAAPPVVVKVEPPPPPPKRKIGIAAGVDMIFNPMAAPSVSLGFAPSVGVRFREPALSITLAMRALWSVEATTARNGLAYRWTYTSGVLSASVHKGIFLFGPSVEVGTLTARSGHTFTDTQAPGFVAVGGHVGVAREIVELVTLHATIDGAYVPLGTTLRNDPNGRLLWAMPPFSLTVAAGLAVPLW